MSYIIYSGITSDGIILGSETMAVYSGGTANNTMVNSSSILYVYNGGMANNTTVNSSGYFALYASGMANNTTVNSSGYLSVSLEGTANSTAVNSGGRVDVYNGGAANSTTVNSSGYLQVNSGGTANSTAVSSGGRMDVLSRGTANSTTVNSGGLLRVSSGGTATEIEWTPCIGRVVVDTGAHVTFASKYSGVYYGDGEELFSSGAEMNDINLFGPNDELYVMNGGKANNTTVNSSAYLHVSSGGTVEHTTINDWGFVYVFSGGTANSTTVEGIMGVYSGGIVRNTTVWDGTLRVYSGGTASNTTLNYRGYFFVDSGGTANSTTVNYFGNIQIFSGGTANSTTVNSGGRLYVESGGTANSTTVNDGGGLHVSSGGTANDTAIIETDFCASEESYVSSGGVANRTTLDGWTILIVEGLVNSTTIISQGCLVIQSGGIASHTVISNYNYGCCPDSATGVMHLDSGGTAYDTTVTTSGFLCVWGGGVANETTVNSRGFMCIASGGETHWLVPCIDGGEIQKWETDSGGSANNISINNGGTLLISKGGIANSTTVATRGSMMIYSGGTMTGQMNFANGAVVSAEDGAILDFDISELAPGNGTARVSNLSVVSGAPVYTLTVSGSQADGIYLLAEGAASFDSAITVVNTSGVQLGTLTVGKTVNLNGDEYSLSRNNGSLTLSINAEVLESTAPVIPVEPEPGRDVLLAHVMPEAEYMYGCTPTAVGMILGYYDLYGYGSAGFSNLIEGDVDLKSRGTDGNAYDMDAFDTVLGRAITSEDYVYRFVSRDGVETTPEQELEYAFKSDNRTLNTDAWNCIADYLGTGQYWRGNDNLSTRTVYGPLNGLYEYSRTNTTGTSDDSIILLYNYDQEITTTSGSISRTILFVDESMECGLDLYVQSRGYRLDESITGTYQVDVNGGFFTFADYMWEIDAGRPVLIHIDGHSMVGYGYKESTREIIFDDCYRSDQRMVWGGTYNYAGEDRKLQSITVIALDESSGEALAAVQARAKSDIDGNGVSDVMFVWTGNNYQHGYWMNGTSTWRSAGGSHPAEWVNLGCHDMTGDGKADSVLFGNVTSEAGVHGAYIGYYADANDLPDGSTWVNIGYLNNVDDIDWKNKVGNLTGNESGANSIVWYAPELYALGAWTDGTENWVELSKNFGGDAWTLVGCGDFTGDGADSVVMAYQGGTTFYAVDLDGTSASLGNANWSGWDVRAIGDFAGDGRDDMVLFHKDSGAMVMLADGNADHYTSIGQLDSADWFVVGAGDYNGDQRDDLLVRQYSTGMLGYYSGGDTTQWNVLGYGVSMDWTVIA